MAKPPASLEMTDAQASMLALEHGQFDPFSDIPDALLSAAHVQRYAAKTGMLHPFYPEALKAASYEVHLAGQVFAWRSEGEEPNVREIKRGIDATLELAPNSITFVQVEPQFRLPHYIAVRFNLRIGHVHRGLLLGTGPLVDPGFEGKLLIPLHNLTATAYRIDLSEALIWLEFTKTSYCKAGGADPRYHFPERAKNKTPEDYLWKASGGAPILSSIPKAVQDASKRADEAERQARKSASSLSTMRNLGLIAILTGVGGIAAVVFSSLNLGATLTNQMLDVHKSIETQIGELAKARAELNQAQQQIADLQVQLKTLRQPIPQPPAPQHP